MIPVDGQILLALSFFLISLQVKDATYARNDTTGIDEQNVIPRCIEAAVYPSGGRNFKIAFGGTVSDGDIALITESVLSVDDNYTNNSRKPQSFVFYGGWCYRVVEISNWIPQAGVYAYRASRHVTQDIV